MVVIINHDTDPAHAEDMVCVRVLSSRLVLSRMFLFTLSYVERSPRFTRAARQTFGQQPRHSPSTPACCRTFLTNNFTSTLRISQSVSQLLLSPCRIPTTLNSGRFAKKSPSSLHLYLGLYQVRGRRHQLPNTCKIIELIFPPLPPPVISTSSHHPRQHLLPHGKAILVIFSQSVPDLLVS